MIEGDRERRKAMREREIENLLLRLGANRSYTGFYYVIYAVQLSIEDGDKLQLISKWLYPEIPYISTMRREKYQNAGCIDME